MHHQVVQPQVESAGSPVQPELKVSRDQKGLGHQIKPGPKKGASEENADWMVCFLQSRKLTYSKCWRVLPGKNIKSCEFWGFCQAGIKKHSDFSGFCHAKVAHINRNGELHHTEWGEGGILVDRNGKLSKQHIWNRFGFSACVGAPRWTGHIKVTQLLTHPKITSRSFNTPFLLITSPYNNHKIPPQPTQVGFPRWKVKSEKPCFLSSMNMRISTLIVPSLPLNGVKNAASFHSIWFVFSRVSHNG